MVAAAAASPWASLGLDTTPLLDKQLEVSCNMTGAQRPSLLDPKPNT
jgi:hypothetical protein